MRSGAVVVRDWDDLLSPIVVKELRQGLRERTFVYALVLLQVIAVTLTLFALGGTALGFPARAAYATLNFVIGFILILVIPSRGFTSISQEIRQNTLELVLISPMTIWQVGLGKWLTSVILAFVLVSTVLPYEIVDYFLGGGDLVSSIVIFFFMIIISSFISVVMVGLSAISNWFVRFISLGAVIILPYTLSDHMPSTVWAWALLFLIFIPPIIFELMAESLGTPYGNRTGRRRLLGLLFVSAAYVLEAYSKWDEGLYLCIILFFLFCSFEMASLSVPKWSQVRPFARLKGLGLLLAPWFLPGWVSAFCFSLPPVLLASWWVAYWTQLPDKYPLYWCTSLASLQASFVCLKIMRLSNGRAFLIIVNFAFAIAFLFAITSLEYRIRVNWFPFHNSEIEVYGAVIALNVICGAFLATSVRQWVHEVAALWKKTTWS